MIRYKVVSASNCSVIVQSNSSYHIEYSKDKILVDKKGMGFFCFKTKKEAEEFCDTLYYNPILYHTIIKKVQTFGRGFVPKVINYGTFNLHNFYKNKKTANKSFHIPKGTICYKKIKVLE